jgi:hypothetical protein
MICLLIQYYFDAAHNTCGAEMPQYPGNSRLGLARTAGWHMIKADMHAPFAS